MPRTLALVLLAAAGLVPALANPAPEPADPARAVERLVGQLADRNPQVRESAHRALTEMGAEALPALHRAKDHGDPEVRRRVGILIEAKETAARLAPRRITLHARGKPVKDVVAELAKQSGYKIEFGSDNAKANAPVQGFDFDLDNVPFWEAVKKVSGDAGLGLQSYYRGDGQLTLFAGDRTDPYVHTEGVFRVAATGFYYNRQVQFGNVPRDGAADGQRSERMSLSLTVTVEPRLRMLNVGEVQMAEATDDRGNSMLAGEAAARRFIFRHDGYKTITQNTQVALAYPDREARKAKRLRGSIPVTLLMEERADIVVDKILEVKKQAFKAGTTELTVEEVAEEKEGARKTYKVKLKLRDTAKNPDPSVTAALDQRLELQDAKGNKYRTWGYSLNSNGNEAEGTFHFTDFGGGVEAPAKLVYFTWVTLPHHVGFDFKDLPLP